MSSSRLTRLPKGSLCLPLVRCPCSVPIHESKARHGRTLADTWDRRMLFVKSSCQAGSALYVNLRPMSLLRVYQIRIFTPVKWHSESFSQFLCCKIKNFPGSSALPWSSAPSPLHLETRFMLTGAPRPHIYGPHKALFPARLEASALTNQRHALSCLRTLSPVITSEMSPSCSLLVCRCRVYGRVRFLTVVGEMPRAVSLLHVHPGLILLLLAYNVPRLATV